MKIAQLALFALLAPWALQGQNLVPNPSFESVLSAPCSWLTAPAQLPAAVSNWTMPSDGSTDVFTNMVSTTCYAHNFSTNGSAIGQQAPRTGNAQSALLTYGAGCGSIPNYREYLQVALTSPMLTGQSYNFEFWVSLADNSNTATNNFGVHFRTSSFFQATCFVISPVPQFNSTTIITSKTAWTRVNGSITASANWTHIIIGNFSSNAATSTQSVGGALGNTRYFIDDISVTPAVVLPAAHLDFAAERNESGSVDLEWNRLEAEDGFDLQVQRSGDGNVWESVMDAAQAELTWNDRFAPNKQLYYRLRYSDQDGDEHTSEAVEVGPAENSGLRAYPSPSPVQQGGISYLQLANADNAIGSISLLDQNGCLVWASQTGPLSGLDRYPIPTINLKPGIYFVQVRATNHKAFTTRLVVTN